MNINQLPIIRFLVRYARTYKIKAALIVLAVLVLFGMGVQTMLQRADGDSERERTPKVSLLHVGEYQVENAIIESVGEVESLSQVELRAQVSERIKEIRVRVGQEISRGQVLVVLDNASLTAQINQGKATLEGARVALERSKLEQQQLFRGDTLDKSYEDGLAVLANVYDELDDILEDVDDILFGFELSGGGEDNIQYYANRINSNVLVFRVNRLYKETENLHVKGVVTYQAAERGSGETRLQAIKDGYDLVTKTAEAIKTGRDSVREFQDTILGSNAVHEKQDIIDGHAEDLAVHAAVVNNHITSLLAIRNTINVQLDAVETSPISVQSAELAVTQAQAALENLLAQQEKVVIVSPISGTVASIPGRLGELVGLGEIVASIVNPGSLQVKTFVSGRDIPFVTQGARALVEGVFEGSVTSVAPSLDPQTKKVETLVAVLGDGNKKLVVGEFANVKIFIEESLRNRDVFFLPLESVKVNSEGSFVFTVNRENTIERHYIELGRVIGDSIEVLNGVTKEMRIVFSARGLEVGDIVNVE